MLHWLHCVVGHAPMSFFSRLKTEDTGRTIKGRHVVRLLADFTYTHRSSFSIDVTVPAGFETDYASIPWWARLVFSPTGDHRFAAVVHDWLCSKEAECDRAVGDAIFRQAMIDLDVPRWRIGWIYSAVRAWGWLKYHKR